MAKRKQTTHKRGSELQFDGFDRQLYCWIRQHRAMCAVHKSLYYDYSHPIIDDFQFDRLEKRLTVVEQRHPDIADAVTAEGYLSPAHYVDSLRIPSVMARAELLLQYWKSQGCPELQLKRIDKNESEDDLYADALKHIQAYPI